MIREEESSRSFVFLRHPPTCWPASRLDGDEAHFFYMISQSHNYGISRQIRTKKLFPSRQKIFLKGQFPRKGKRLKKSNTDGKGKKKSPNIIFFSLMPLYRTQTLDVVHDRVLTCVVSTWQSSRDQHIFPSSGSQCLHPPPPPPSTLHPPGF